MKNTKNALTIRLFRFVVALHLATVFVACSGSDNPAQPASASGRLFANKPGDARTATTTFSLGPQDYAACAQGYANGYEQGYINVAAATRHPSLVAMYTSHRHHPDPSECANRNESSAFQLGLKQGTADARHAAGWCSSDGAAGSLCINPEAYNTTTRVASYCVQGAVAGAVAGGVVAAMAKKAIPEAAVVEGLKDCVKGGAVAVLELWYESKLKEIPSGQRCGYLGMAGGAAAILGLYFDKSDVSYPVYVLGSTLKECVKKATNLPVSTTNCAESFVNYTLGNAANAAAIAATLVNIRNLRGSAPGWWHEFKKTVAKDEMKDLIKGISKTCLAWNQAALPDGTVSDVGSVEIADAGDTLWDFQLDSSTPWWVPSEPGVFEQCLAEPVCDSSSFAAHTSCACETCGVGAQPDPLGPAACACRWQDGFVQSAAESSCQCDGDRGFTGGDSCACVDRHQREGDRCLLESATSDTSTSAPDPSLNAANFEGHVLSTLHPADARRWQSGAAHLMDRINAAGLEGKLAGFMQDSGIAADAARGAAAEAIQTMTEGLESNVDRNLLQQVLLETECGIAVIWDSHFNIYSNPRRLEAVPSLSYQALDCAPRPHPDVDRQGWYTASFATPVEQFPIRMDGFSIPLPEAPPPAPPPPPPPPGCPGLDSPATSESTLGCTLPPGSGQFAIKVRTDSEFPAGSAGGIGNVSEWHAAAGATLTVQSSHSGCEVFAYPGGCPASFYDDRDQIGVWVDGRLTNLIGIRLMRGGWPGYSDVSFRGSWWVEPLP